MIVFIEKDNNCIGKTKRYSSIHKVNCITKSVETFKFSKAADLVSHINTSTFIYYAYIDKNKDNYWINLYKINCINWSEEEILSFDTGIINIDKKDYISLLLNTRIIGINEGYAIVAIPSCNGRYGQHNFNKILLIDLSEKKSFIFPNKIAESDTFLRFDKVWIVQNGKYVIFKTGRIHPFEKNIIFKNQEKSGIFQEYYDSMETVVVCEVNELVNDIKKGTNIDKKNIIQTLNFDGALSLIEKNDRELAYVINLFKKNTLQLAIVNLESCEKNIIELDNYYDEISYVNKKIFGLLQEDKIMNIYDIYKNKKIFTTDQKIVYYDEQNIITFKNNPDSLKRTITVYKLIDDKIIDTIEYNVTSFYFNYEKNMLVLF